ncbi:3'(2'),5'-bisphosphate nucleotidase CysQ [Thaumasiovibrio sp. DFM-14]|uniref:3'(2'),5'-bisphosphate nucleotidase CysQ n=1 Tax=Thaumasiovibrio sp. DFM-14 TaxID=3384792 RepID=UPI00399FA9BD
MKDLLEHIVEIAERAGKVVLSYYNENVEIEYKQDASPLTAADIAANRYIVDKLIDLKPEIPILSEESKHAPWCERKHWTQFWLVDPIDGTKEFLQHNDEFTVNIALIEMGKPKLSVIVAPALEKTWYANGQQAWLKEREGVKLLNTRSNKPPVVVGSRSHKSKGMSDFLAKIGKHTFVSAGSSLKFCMVAEGAAQYYPRLAPTMMWDTAAGQCIAESAGAKVQDLNGMPLSYHRETLTNSYFIVSS